MLAVCVDAPHVQVCRERLAPYLPHGAPLPRVIAEDSGHKRLLLHPRIQTPAMLPAELREEVERRFDARWLAHVVPIPEPVWRGLFIVQFASRSRDEPALAPGLPSSWRRVLSNFDARQPLRIGERTYASVEHYFQGRKAECSDRPEMGAWFSREYDGPEQVGDDPRVAKQAGARKGYRAHGATLDTERWVSVRDEVMQTALQARWEQDELFARIVRSTRGMTLLHFERAGARSYWGGSLDKQTGRIKGQNRLGTMMMALRDGENVG